MNRWGLIIAMSCAAFAGCSSVNQPAGQSTGTQTTLGDDPTYQVGSRIPVKPGTNSDVKTMDKQSVDNMMRPPAYVPSRSGN